MPSTPPTLFQFPVFNFSRACAWSQAVLDRGDQIYMCLTAPGVTRTYESYESLRRDELISRASPPAISLFLSSFFPFSSFAAAARTRGIHKMNRTCLGETYSSYFIPAASPSSFFHHGLSRTWNSRAGRVETRAKCLKGHAGTAGVGREKRERICASAVRNDEWVASSVSAPLGYRFGY
jgi:hypothetical protein